MDNLIEVIKAEFQGMGIGYTDSEATHNAEEFVANLRARGYEMVKADTIISVEQDVDPILTKARVLAFKNRPSLDFNKLDKMMQNAYLHNADEALKSEQREWDALHPLVPDDGHGVAIEPDKLADEVITPEEKPLEATVIDLMPGIGNTINSSTGVHISLVGPLNPADDINELIKDSKENMAYPISVVMPCGYDWGVDTAEEFIAMGNSDIDCICGDPTHHIVKYTDNREAKIDDSPTGTANKPSGSSNTGQSKQRRKQKVKKQARS